MFTFTHQENAVAAEVGRTDTLHDGFYRPTLRDAAPAHRVKVRVGFTGAFGGIGLFGVYAHVRLRGLFNHRRTRQGRGLRRRGKLRRLLLPFGPQRRTSIRSDERVVLPVSTFS